MNREDIIRMAHQSGLHLATDSNWMPIINLEYAEHFAALVASAEREACAKVCDGYSDGRHANMADLCAEAIRARGQA
jgi:hypothetical protein